jgi:hypothetical protein
MNHGAKKGLYMSKLECRPVTALRPCIDPVAMAICRLTTTSVSGCLPVLKGYIHHSSALARWKKPLKLLGTSREWRIQAIR